VERKKILLYSLLLVMTLNIFMPLPVTQASGLDSIVNTLAASSAPSDGSGGGLFGQLFNLLFGKLLAPLLNIFHGSATPGSTGETAATESASALPPTPGSDQVLNGRVIILDPGHGGSNPGAVANDSREADNNLAVGLKLRDILTAAGAKVVMTRDSDRTVAPEGNSLRRELQARVDIAEANNADIFVSLHSNENEDSSISGATSYYSSDKSRHLAEMVQHAVVKATQAEDRGILQDNFYVLRSTSMPSTLIEMGFVSNPAEAARLNSDSYRTTIAQGIFNGITKYFQNA